MKHLKTFESWNSPMSYDEMCDYLCQCGYDMYDLEGKTEEELQMMCNSMEETIEESYDMGKEEMIEYLCNKGCSMRELLKMEEEELRSMCGTMMQEEETIQEKKKWISDAIKNPGALRKKMGKKEGEKISDSEIDDELAKLHKKDKDPKKKGDQLSPSDAKKKKQLTLARNLKNMK